MKARLLTKEQVRKFIEENDIKSMEDVEDVFKEMFKMVLEEMLNAELDEELGYIKYDYKNKKTNNSRNGHSKKKVNSSYGEIELAVPRDRESEFEPIVVKKHQRDITNIEDSILSMYAKGMTTRDICEHVKEIYGREISPEWVSRITDRIIPLMEEWQERALKEVYAIVYLDGVVYRVKDEGRVKQKTAYVVIGIDIEGKKDVLGIWLGGAESAKFWMAVLTNLKNRGVRDVLIFGVDGLVGLEEAIKAVFPDSEIQPCIVHKVRNSVKYVSYKDLKEFTRDLKEVYRAASQEAGYNNLMKMKEKWGEKYPLAIKSWEKEWERISTFFKYSPEIRRLIYTTNPIESFNSQLRKVTKTRRVFPNDTSVLKILYLATMNRVKKWEKSKIKNWNQILSQLVIEFGERVEKYLYNRA